MTSWKEFQLLHPVLQRIEKKYHLLKKFEEQKSQLSKMFPAGELEDTLDTLLVGLQQDAQEVAGKVYYWLFPFYAGDFLKLVAALGALGAMEAQKDDEETRDAFYRFFMTVPMEVRLTLGERLDSPELTAQAERIQQKINDRRELLKVYVETHYSN